MSDKFNYDSSSIGGELGLKGIRLNPSQHLGSKGTEGALQSLLEIIQNGTDEAPIAIELFSLTEYVIKITINKDDSATIVDMGRGIPVDYSDKFELPAIEAVFEHSNVGGKGYGYVEKGKSAYTTPTIGTHGSGAACSNATSDYFYVDVFLASDGKHYQLKYEKAEKIQSVKLIGDAPKNVHGTSVRFRPSREVFDLYSETRGKVSRYYNFEELKNILIEYAYNTDNIVFDISFEEENGEWKKEKIKSNDYMPEDRIKPYIKSQVFRGSFSDEEKEYKIEIIAGVSDRIGQMIRDAYLSCNMLPLVDATPLTVIQEEIDRLSINVAKRFEDEGIKGANGEPITEAMIVANHSSRPSKLTPMYINMSIADPNYSGQSKQSLRVPRISDSIRVKFNELLNTEFSEFKRLVMEVTYLRYKEYIDGLKLQQQEKERQRKLREERAKKKRLLQTNNSASGIEGLSDADENIYHAIELDTRKVFLYLAEGKSAVDSSLVAARNMDNETVVALRGRLPNVLTRTPEDLENNDEYRILYRLLSKRYRGIVLAQDPDEDGDYIRSLVLLTILKDFPHYLTEGRVFNLKLPKFVAIREGKQELLFNIEEREEHEKTNMGWIYRSFKGVGSIPMETMKEVLRDRRHFIKFDPKTIKDGFQELVKFFSGEGSFKKNYLLDNYASPDYVMYQKIKGRVMRKHEVNLTVNTLKDDFTPYLSLDGVEREDPLIDLINKSNNKN